VLVEAYIQGLLHPLRHLSGQVITPLACSDDRLGHLLQHLRKPTYGHAIERALHARSLAVYAWSQDVIRGDATTVSGTHEVSDRGRVQLGHSSDNRRRLYSSPGVSWKGIAATSRLRHKYHVAIVRYGIHLRA
jgi:hypothetical protein